MAKKKEYTCVLVETDDDGVTWITFNRPEKRNAMNPTLHVEMEQILFEHETDEETIAIARELIAKSPTVLAFTKQGIRAVRDMNMAQAYEYLSAKGVALRAADPEQTRARGMREFLDEKKFRPGFEPVKRPDGEK